MHQRLTPCCCLTLGLLVGCAATHGRNRTSYGGFTQADVTWTKLAQDGHADTHATLRGAELDQLHAFFPRVGTRARSDIFGAWMPGMEISFVRQDGSLAKVILNPTYKLWSEGKGDWELKPGFAVFIEQFAPKVR